jgi:uncharacterized protein YecE (DUF72 family)
MDVWVGTSGYSYADWVGDFYPADTRPAQMLPYYCRQFPLVELNFTFYRVPTRDMLLRLADKTPAAFQFIVKLPQTISHERSAEDIAPFRKAVLGLRRRKQLKGLLCQLPQSTHYDRRHLTWLRHLAAALADLRLAVEFRHHSWARDGVPAWLAEHGLDLVAVDVPDIASLYPRGWVQAGSRGYVRLHSRNGANWYRGEKKRYDYNFDEEVLEEWVAAAAASSAEEALFLFNNCHRSQAAHNARLLEVLLARQAPELNVILAAGAQPPVQRSLFEA